MLNFNKKHKQTSSITKEQKEAPQEAEQVTGETLENPASPHQQQEGLGQSSGEYSQEAPHSIDDAPNHFDDLIGAEEQSAQPATMFKKEEFHTLFCGGFTAASHMTGLKSMAVDKEDGGAIACTAALYDTILDIPMLHFLLNPFNKWFERAIVIGAFTAPMAQGISQELAERKNNPKPPPEGAPQGSPPNGNGTMVSLREQAKMQEA